MLPQISRAAYLVLLAGITMLTACKKDLSQQEEELSKPKGVKEYKPCEITKLVAYDPWSPAARVFIFEYNSKGDPVKITPSIIGTGTPKHEFRYDNKGRLTDYIGPYLNDAFEFWHEYGYDSKDRIVQDTLYIFGLYGEEPTNGYPPSHRIISYEYDSKDRISKSTTVWTYGYPTDVAVFTYDDNGNLIRPGFVYDNKINPLRTNRIWMFISRDYSMNNPWAGASFNDNGLPTTLVVPHTLAFLSSVYPHYIEYACKGNSN